MSFLRLENITKSFDSFVANDNISFEIEAGKIHAILGENGAGKTTLMNIISGLYQPDSGKIYLENKQVNITSPNTAIKLGIGMIHQHFMLVPQLTVAENIILGTDNSFSLNLKQKQQQIAELSESFGLEINPQAKIQDLPVGTQQRVEILKVLYRKAKLLILDEPTAVLTPLEIESLIKTLRQLATAGNTIIFISHKLNEIFNLCDTVTVLQRGKVVANRNISQTNSQELAALMVGREIDFRLNKYSLTPGKVVLSVKNLQVADHRNLIAVNNVSFELREREILGIAGVDGNGQRELADTLAGIRKIKAGQIQLSKNSKLAYIPEDRQKMGLILQYSIAQNLILKTFNKLPYCKNFLLKPQKINHRTTSAIEEFDIRASETDITVNQLSGGNQQKIVLARELSDNPALIIAMQPTRGLDIGATETVQQQLLQARERGAAIIYISTELEEVINISDRVAVMYRGQFVGLLDSQTATVEEIGLLMGGGIIRNL
ncbi:MAG: ABC transporter ATP-binding protein [Cyanobacteria bacterium J06573_2]